MMKTDLRYWMTAVVVASCAGLVLAAAPPERISFQGVLRDSAGAPVTGSQTMIFRLYDSDGAPSCSTGTLLISDDQGSQMVSGGLFKVALGGGRSNPVVARGSGAA